MAEPITFEYEGVKRSINATQAALANPKPRLREVARVAGRMIRDFIAAEGEGTWKPFAPSTLARRQQVGTSTINKQGQVRAAILKRYGKQLDRIRKTVLRGKGWTPALRKQYELLVKRAAALTKRQERALKQSYLKRKIGKKEAETRKLLQRMPSTIRAKVFSFSLILYSRAGKVADAQNAARPFFPPVRVNEILDFFTKVMETDLEEAWKAGQ